ncbi:MAG: hypothetical protein V7K68_30295 [Nostoc sp.]
MPNSLPQAFLTYDLLELSKMMRQILNTQCHIPVLPMTYTIKVKKLKQRPIATLSSN